MKITKIAVTGGPCAGKSTALEFIKKTFANKGYTVFLISETATELINTGIAPWTCTSAARYQAFQMMLQLEKERICELAARETTDDRILIVCDRGAVDSKAYMTQEDYSALVDSQGMTPHELKNRYDAVFHLMTAAKGARDCYTISNNTARTETAEQAAVLDDRIIEAWDGHFYRRIIDNSTDFDGKLKRLVQEIAAFLE